MASQRFCLRWNNHQTNLLSVFDQLLHAETFTDVTLAVEGQYLKAHKVWFFFVWYNIHYYNLSETIDDRQIAGSRAGKQILKTENDEIFLFECVFVAEMKIQQA